MEGKKGSGYGMIDQRSKTVEFAPVGIWKLDTSLVVTEANNAVARQLGMPKEEVIGKRIAEVLPDVPDSMFDSVLSSGNTLTCQTVTKCKNKHANQSYWEVSVGPLRSTQNLVVGLVISTMEVTEQERLRQQREDFIAALAHNLKAPLVGAEHLLNSITSRKLGPLSSEQEEVLEVLKRSNHRVLSMVQDLLEIYRFESGAGHLVLVPTSVEALAQTSSHEMQALSAEKEIKLEVANLSQMPTMKADVRALKRVLINILDNALKFTPCGGTVRIDAMQESPTSILLFVADTGIGISKEDSERMFERLWQGEPGKSYTPVAGVGLYFCQKIVSAHGGEIWAESTQGKGTTIFIRLPIDASKRSS